MSNGSGVSVSEREGGWRVRWRETVSEGGVERRVQREKNVSTYAAAQELAAKVLRAVETEQPFEPVVRVIAPVEATIDDIVRGWEKFQRSRGREGNTIKSEVTSCTRLLRTMRAAWGIPDTKAVPASRLTREGFAEVAVALRTAPKIGPRGKDSGKRSERTVYGDLVRLGNLWTWAADDPERFPGVPTAPRLMSALLPRPPAKSAPEAPTLAECDAVVRYVVGLGGRAANVALPVVVVGRWTGLRASQIIALSAADVGLDGRTLTIRTGKSAAEKAEPRTVPISTELRDFLLPYVARAEQDGRELLFGHRGGTQVKHPIGTIKGAWEAVTRAGHARREVWAPSSRTSTRPEHAFRAALQSAMVENGVRDEVIDVFVGHRPRTTRGLHYVSASARFAAMREAVDALPGIDWTGPGADLPENVVALPR